MKETVNIVKPSPFTFQEGPRAVLLLHGFTGNSADVRMLGRYLQKKGYTTHAPIYDGHGLAPEDLLRSEPSKWLDDAVNGYQYLRFLGYQEIAVVGLSIGGALGLEIALKEEVKGITFMCTPVFFDDQNQVIEGFKPFATTHKQLERKDDVTIEKEVAMLINESTKTFHKIAEFIQGVCKKIPQLKLPTLIIQAKDDEIINPENASYLFEHISSEQKQIKWYDDAGHAITLGAKKDFVHKDIFKFLESLDWEE